MTEPAGAALVAELERGFVTLEQPVRLTGGVVELLRPRSAEELISEEDFDRDERLPYWAELWPSARVLAERVLAEPVARATGSGRARTLLELGCGLGLVTIAAMRVGWDVTASDYYADALRFTRANAWRALGREPAVQLIDWRHLPTDMGRFDRVVAADVLYERPYGALVPRVLAQSLVRSGDALIADPGRVGVDAFVASCAELGLPIAEIEEIDWTEQQVRQTIRLYRVVRAA